MKYVASILLTVSFGLVANVTFEYQQVQLLKKEKRYQEAINGYKKIVQKDPRHLSSLADLAALLVQQENYDEAIQYYTQLINYYPNLYSAWYNLGYVYRQKKNYTQAINCYQEALKLNPDYSLAHFGLGLAYLVTGNFALGWPEYEWRWQAFNNKPLPFNIPYWQGEQLHEKTILVVCEQGLGDTFQFVRYARLLKEAGARVILLSQKPLELLLGGCPYIDQVITKASRNFAADFYVHLMSLPLIFKTTLQTIPAPSAYLNANKELVEYWKEYLASDTHFKIGLCWQGNSTYQNAFLQEAVRKKSLDPAYFEPLSRLPNISLYSLQQMNATNVSDLNFTIHTFDSSFDKDHGRFMDTAALMQSLDLIITVDTSIAHLAGALGRPVWVLLPYTADWRWLEEQNDSPWYPTMRLFRQTTPGDWESVIAHVQEALSEITK